MTTKKILPVLLIIAGLIGWVPYNAQNEDNTEITRQTLSETHVNYNDAEAYTQFIENISQKAKENEKSRRLEETKIELEKIAQAKAEEAKKQAEAKKAEEERIAQAEAEAARIASETAATETVADETSYDEGTITDYSQPVETAAAPAVQSRTDGFNFNGYHFDVAWFSGSGQVPADSYIYRWSADPSHYLVEMMGTAGGVIRELYVGSQIVIDGQRYTIFNMQSGVPNDENAYYNMKSVGAAITFQTCDYQVGANGRYNLTIWYANPS